MSRERRKEQKKKARQERIRQQKHRQQSQPPDLSRGKEERAEASIPDASPFLPPSAQTADERMMHGLGGTFFVGNMSGPGRLESAQAQELAYQAMDADDPAQAEVLARKAVELDPDCVDALCVLADVWATSPIQHARMLGRAVAAGERVLGAQYFNDNKGLFWGLVETRPYMRARASLAGALAQAGRFPEAIAHYEALLELNPNDNQGNRHELMGLYFLTDNLAGVRRLHKQYKDDYGIVAVWSHVLERFLAKDFRGATRALEAAIKRNPHVLPFLTGDKPLPDELPDLYTVGEESEAIPVIMTLGPAFEHHPGALEWLSDVTKK